MVERPILFSGPMVRAILDGRKTQTRRIVREGAIMAFVDVLGRDPLPAEACLMRCPYGKAGDRLWVRETWQRCEGLTYRADCPPGVRYVSGPAGLGWRPSIFLRRADSRLTLDVVSIRIERLYAMTEGDVAAEGVDRAALDSLLSANEQRELDEEEEVNGPTPPTALFAAGWDKINKRGPWASNPWVWVVEFKRCP